MINLAALKAFLGHAVTNQRKGVTMLCDGKKGKEKKVPEAAPQVGLDC
jgi:hypothetical protein